MLALEQRLSDLKAKLTGDRTLRSRSAPTLPSITERVQRIVSSQWASSSPPTRTNLDAYRIAGDAFRGVLTELERLVQQGLVSLEDRLEAAGGPWTPGRVPRWSPE